MLDPEARKYTHTCMYLALREIEEKNSPKHRGVAWIAIILCMTDFGAVGASLFYFLSFKKNTSALLQTCKAFWR